MNGFPGWTLAQAQGWNAQFCLTINIQTFFGKDPQGSQWVAWSFKTESTLCWLLLHPCEQKCKRVRKKLPNCGEQRKTTGVGPRRKVGEVSSLGWSCTFRETGQRTVRARRNETGSSPYFAEQNLLTTRNLSNDAQTSRANLQQSSKAGSPPPRQAVAQILHRSLEVNVTDESPLPPPWAPRASRWPSA